MKKNILIFCAVITAFSLTAFGYINWNHVTPSQEETGSSQSVAVVPDLLDFRSQLNNPDLVYKVESRFMTTVTKENLHQATSILDILPTHATNSLSSYQNVKVALLLTDHEISEIGESEVLNPFQLRLLKSTDYSTNFYITADCKNKNAATGELEDYDLVYYMTITPEKQAEFTAGHDFLIEYLKENSKEKTAIIAPNQVKPGKINFTVTKTGTISDVKLTSTSGYPSVDETFVDLISNMPEKWNPATNSKGEKVDQEFVFFFGLQGC